MADRRPGLEVNENALDVETVLSRECVNDPGIDHTLRIFLTLDDHHLVFE